MIANDVIHFIKKGGQNEFLLKVDFNKAFDSVNQTYLEKVMMYMGFGDKWISQMEILI